MYIAFSCKLPVFKNSAIKSFPWAASSILIVSKGFKITISGLCHQKELPWFLLIFVCYVYWRKLVTVNRMTAFFILLWQFLDIFLNLQICNKVSFSKKNLYAFLHSKRQLNLFSEPLEMSVSLNMSFVGGKWNLVIMSMSCKICCPSLKLILFLSCFLCIVIFMAWKLMSLIQLLTFFWA